MMDFVERSWTNVHWTNMHNNEFKDVIINTFTLVLIIYSWHLQLFSLQSKHDEHLNWTDKRRRDSTALQKQANPIVCNYKTIQFELLCHVANSIC